MCRHRGCWNCLRHQGQARSAAPVPDCPARIDSVWSVVPPRSGRERLRFECYDAAGEQVLTPSSPLNPCPLVQDGWQKVIGRFEAGKSV